MKGIGRKRSEAFGNPQGAIANIEGVESLFSGFNSKPGEEAGTGVIASEREPIFTLKIEDSVLLGLSRQRSREYDAYYNPDIKPRQEDNYDYWKGKQKGSVGLTSRGTDNIIFESTETLLPIISRENAEASVTADDTDDGLFLADSTSEILMRKADDTRLKSKIKSAARNWALYFIGCLKMGWDEKTNDMTFQLIDPLKLILDPKGFFDGGEFIGRYIGEKKSATAEELAENFPKFAESIKALVQGEMGTILNYTEWWTNEYVYWQLESIILDKRSNPYWNEDSEEEMMDETGMTSMQKKPGVNHFASAKMPYSFLSVFNTGKQPHDETSLIEQCKPLQDIVNKRLRQIDKNADETNNGWVFSKHFTADQAKEAVDSVKNGGAIIAVTDNLNESVARLTAPNLADYVFQDMQDKREQIYNIMGVRGSTAQGVISEETVRGKVQLKGQDVDRLSLVVEQVEQFIDHLFNLAVQTMYVYYTEENVSRVLGPEKASRYLQILKSGPSRRLCVSVKEGSTIPKDPLMRRNEAMDLWGAQVIDPETLFERLGDFPDPKAAALKLETYKQSPQQYFADLGGQPAMQQAIPNIPGSPLTETPPL